MISVSLFGKRESFIESKQFFTMKLCCNHGPHPPHRETRYGRSSPSSLQPGVIILLPATDTLAPAGYEKVHWTILVGLAYLGKLQGQPGSAEPRKGYACQVGFGPIGQETFGISRRPGTE